MPHNTCLVGEMSGELLIRKVARARRRVNAYVREMLARSAGQSDVAATLERMIEMRLFCEKVTTGQAMVRV